MDDVILGQVAPIVGQRYGVAERHLSQLIHMNQNVLGEGCFGKVVAVTVEGCYPLCIKVYADGIGNMMEEVKNLKALEGVAGLPRVFGFSTNPPAFIMTRHGTTTLDKIDEIKGR